MMTILWIEELLMNSKSCPIYECNASAAELADV